MRISPDDARALLHGFATADESSNDVLVPDALTMQLLLLVVDELVERVEELEGERHASTLTASAMGESRSVRLQTL